MSRSILNQSGAIPIIVNAAAPTTTTVEKTIVVEKKGTHMTVSRNTTLNDSVSFVHCKEAPQDYTITLPKITTDVKKITIYKEKGNTLVKIAGTDIQLKSDEYVNLISNFETKEWKI